MYLSMYLSMYVCIYLSMHVRMYLCMYVSMYAFFNVSIHVSVEALLGKRLRPAPLTAQCSATSRSIYVSMYLCTCVSMHVSNLALLVTAQSPQSPDLRCSDGDGLSRLPTAALLGAATCPALLSTASNCPPLNLVCLQCKTTQQRELLESVPRLYATEPPNR